MEKPPVELTAEQRRKPLTLGDLPWLMEVIANAVNERIAAVPQVRYCGTWAADVEYAKGAMVTRDGSLWHAEIGSKAVVPGKSESSAIWRLAVKRGKDAPR